ncbi:MAG: hypothetical protein M1831_000726 [Alyxoria varia]|nr:MAG: hypothetical protein M1831_000726 [Alyxoria varia]
MDSANTDAGAEASANPWLIIDPRGDTLLVMDDGSKILVNATALSNVSEPLGCLFFNAAFQEGQARANNRGDGPVEVSLHEDNSRGMHILCEFIYHDFGFEDYQHTTREDWVNVAILCDKYLVKNTLKRMIAIFLADRFAVLNAGYDALFDWGQVAFLLACRTSFDIFSDRMCRTYQVPGHLQLKCKAEPWKAPAEGVFGVLERYIHQVRSQLAREVQALTYDLVAVEQRNDTMQLHDKASLVIGRVLHNFQVNGISIEFLLAFSLPRNHPSDPRSPNYMRLSESWKLARERSTLLIANWTRRSLGLCLGCAKAGIPIMVGSCGVHPW